MKLDQLLDVQKLNEHITSRVVNVQRHPVLPLRILNYGQKAQFENIWDDVTIHTRGLIVDAANEIVARPFQKFFNLGHTGRTETWMENLPPEMPEITEKMDGSLGILYRYKGFTGMASRGSFASDQAAWASSWYQRKLSQSVWPDGWTPLFEIIYPDNRIVVKYEWEGLVLLALVNNETGEEMGYTDLLSIGVDRGLHVVAARRNVHVEELRSENVQNKEGYVCTWRREAAPPLKIKIKFIEYCRLHRLLTSISPKVIWEMLRDKMPFDELLTDVPSHYSEWVNYWKNGLQAEYGRIEQKALAIYGACPYPRDGKDKAARKQLAEYFTSGNRKEVCGILFSMLDSQTYDDIIWKMVREKTRDQEPFKRDIE